MAVDVSCVRKDMCGKYVTIRSYDDDFLQMKGSVGTLYSD